MTENTATQYPEGSQLAIEAEIGHPLTADEFAYLTAPLTK